MIKAAANQLILIKNILQKHVPGAEIRVFGSRLAETVKKYSDLDLVIMGEKEVAPDIMAKIKYDFEESDLPFRVDVLDWHKISDEFRKVISKNYEVL
jgi:predicted nucleotidyltransferase